MPTWNILEKLFSILLKVKEIHQRHCIDAKGMRRACDGIKTVLFLDNKWDYKEIAETLLPDEDTTKKDYKRYTDVFDPLLF